MKPLLLPCLATALYSLALLSHWASAQVPSLLSFQGRVCVAGVNFESTPEQPGLFKFALVSGDGSITFWSNDGTSTAGSEPAAAVPLPVAKGLYSVPLGDPSLGASMTAIPQGVFTNADVQLRVWFSDGVHGFELLNPDQRIAAVGYAMMAGAAATVPDGSITSSKIAPGAVGGAQLGPNLTLAGTLGATHFLGDGAGLVNLSADNIASGTLADARLSFPLTAWGKAWLNSDDAATARSAFDALLRVCEVKHASGTVTPYYASADTDAARGAALMRAIADLSAPILQGGTVNDAYVEITLSPGVFEVTTTQVLRASNASLRGAGMGATVVKMANGANIANPVLMVGILKSTHPAHDVTVSDLTIDCNLQGQTSGKVDGLVGYGTNTKFSRIRAINWGTLNTAENFAISIANSGGRGALFPTAPPIMPSSSSAWSSSRRMW